MQTVAPPFQHKVDTQAVIWAQQTLLKLHFLYVFTLQVGSFALKTLKDESQHIDFGTTIPACILRPETCTNGGSMAFWLKVTNCAWNEGIVSSYGAGFTGLVMECKDGTFQFVN